MTKLYRILIHALLGFWLIYIFGCASTAKKHAQRLQIPPGLDSTTVIRANDMAENNFVSSQREQEAERLAKTGKNELNRVDEFWAYLEQRAKKNKKLTKTEAEQFAREYALGEKSLARWKELSKDGVDEKAGQRAQEYCIQAQQHLEKAIQINPFDKNARVLLALTYYNLQHIFGLEKNFDKAVEILERLTRIEKGEHELFRLLGQNYMALKDYKKASTNFKKAQIVLVKTSFDAPPDTSQLFYYLYAQGDACARMYDASNAMKLFKAATAFARTPQEKADVKNYREWVNWDGGNIKASEQWDQIIALEVAKNYRKMAGLCSKLLPDLKTKKAKIYVLHKLAVAEFEFLGNKAKAVERMHQVYKLLPRKALNANDKTLQPFLDTYGAMLYRLGIEAREKEEKKLSLAYFTKAVSFKWDQMAKAYIELVTLLWNDPDQAIQYGKKALANSNGLSAKESCELLSLMVRAHKSAGHYDEARSYFNKWKQCRSKL